VALTAFKVFRFVPGEFVVQYSTGVAMVAAMASGAITLSSPQLLRAEGCSQEGGRVAQELSQMASFGGHNAGFLRRAHGLHSTSAPASV